MSFELDHLFIYTTLSEAAAKQLSQLGLTEGSSNVHLGQGTTNRRFFFHNLMLELLWVHDAAEAQSDITRLTHLWERWIGQPHTACPFGVCLRPKTQNSNALPFSSWDYCPAYLPPGMTIAVANNAPRLTEPMLFYLAFRQRQDSYTGSKAEPLNHALGLREATRVSLTLPHQPVVSEALQTVITSGLLNVQPGNTYLMEIGFDGESQGQHHDFRPTIPLVFHW